MFEDYWVTKDELFAVGACFTVLVFAFAYVFLAVQEIWPGSFVAYQGEGQRTFLELIYLSAAAHERRPLRRRRDPSGGSGRQHGGAARRRHVRRDGHLRLVALTVMRSRQ